MTYKQHFFVIFFWLYAASLLASELSISPTKLMMSPHEKITILRVKNLGKNPSLLQVEIKKWTQEEGEDIYTSTHDIILAPLIFEVAPGKTQLIRMTQRHPRATNSEQAYRVFLHEILKQENASSLREQDGLNFRLEFVIPFFIAPTQKVQGLSYDWQVNKVTPTTVSITLKNMGIHHLFINQLWLENTKGRALFPPQKVFLYLLPMTRRHMTITVNEPIHDMDVVIKTNLDVEKSENDKSKK